jgi:hypothetical protein
MLLAEQIRTGFNLEAGNDAGNVAGNVISRFLGKLGM